MPSMMAHRQGRPESPLASLAHPRPPWRHDHDIDHRGQQGPRPRDGPPAARRGPRRLGRRPRPEARGRAAAEELGARFVQLDVTDDASRRRRGRDRRGRDRPRRARQQRRHLRRHRVRARRPRRRRSENVLATNVVGIVRVTQAFVPLLAQSDAPVIVNVSSGMGSLAVTTDPERVESTIVNARLLAVEGGGEHAHDPVREGAAGDPRQRRRPRLHGDRLQRHRGRRRSSRAPTRSCRWRCSTARDRPAATSTTKARCRGSP